MNSKVTFPELVDAVAAATECPKRVSELFLKELFTAISEALRNGENVRVRGLGLFKLTNVDARKSVNVNTGEEMEIPSHRKVSFVPEKALADAINAPFAEFDTVVLDDSLTEEDLQLMARVDDDVADDANQQVADKEPVRPEPVKDMPALEETVTECPAVEEVLMAECPAVEEKPVLETTEELPIADEKVELKQPENIMIDKEEKKATVVPETEDYCIPEDDDEEYVMNDNKQKNDTDKKDDGAFMRGFMWGALSMFVLYLIAGGGYFMYQHIQTQAIIDTARGTDSIADITAEDVATEAIAGEVQPADAAEQPSESTEEKKEAAESKKEEPQKKQEAVVYDTVTEKQFLTKIAAKHYGNADFWVYIYEENRSIIKNPNTIAPGTKVVIPPASKYGIDKNNPESLKAARKKIQEIESSKK